MVEYINQGNNDTRSGFGEGLTELGRSNNDVVALCADLTGSLKMNVFAKENPNRFFQTGIAEANMIGIAAGLAVGGKIPFTGTFANFSTGRVYDQIRQSVAYSNQNVKICASHAGVTLGEDGATHQILEDIGLMNTLPNLKIFSPSDNNDLEEHLKYSLSSKNKFTTYLRIGKKNEPIIKKSKLLINKINYVSKNNFYIFKPSGTF